jgi:glycosyltransferase involved in cell wall biosynthesis
VSIIIPTYNYGEYLPDALESALNQTYPNVEVIVVDDGSTDNTPKIVKKYNVQTIVQSHQGLASARNNGIKRSKGTFFLCLDGDDMIAPRHIEETLKVMLKSPRTAFVTTGSKIWYEETNFENIFMPRKILFRYSIFAGWVGALGTVLMRRAAFESLTDGFDSTLPAHEDLDLCFRLLQHWRPGLVFEPLHWYRRHTVLLTPETIEARRVASIHLDKKYPYRRMYRRIHGVYKMSLGRLVSFIGHPSSYLQALKEKIQLRIQLHRSSIMNCSEIREYINQISNTLDMKVEWSRNKNLSLYYEGRIKLLKSRVFDYNANVSDRRKRNA